jgi:ligand-binding sensor domain-containing protein
MQKLKRFVVALLMTGLLAACGGSEEPTVEPETVENIKEVVEEVAAVVEEPAAEPTAIPEPTEVPPSPTPEPTNTPEPTPTPEPLLTEPVFYSNGNYTRDAAIFDGKLWTAGSGGLTAYDIETGEGRKYTHFDGLPNVATYSLVTCPINGEDRLIIGYHEGLLIYDAANDSWESGSLVGYNNDDTRIFEIHCDAVNGRLFLDYDDMLIIDLNTGDQLQLEDDEGGLASFTFDDFFQVGNDVWATSYQGVSILAPDNSITILGEDQETWLNDDITDADIAPDGKLWIASSDGIYQQTGEGLSPDAFTLFNKDNSDAISFWGPDYIEFTADGQLWAAFSSDLCQFNTQTAACDTEWDVTDMGLDRDASLKGFDILEDGSFLVHTTFHGAARYDGTSWTAYTLEDQTPHNYFTDFYQTSDGKIWSTGWALVYTDIDASEWTKPDGLFGDDMVEAADGTLWFSTSYRATKFDGQKVVEYTADDNGLLDESIQAIALGSDGTVYLGAYEGYSTIGPDGETVTAIGIDQGWEIGNIRDLHTVGDNVYAATTEGLVQLTGDTWTSLVDESFIAYGSNSTAVLEALESGSESLGLKAGTVLMGTSDGLMYFDNGQLTAEKDVTGSIRDIFVDQETGEIYVTADRNDGDDAGFYSYSPDSGWSFMSVEEFPSEYMLGVFKDEEGTVWVSSGDSTWGGGIVRMP